MITVDDSESTCRYSEVEVTSTEYSAPPKKVIEEELLGNAGLLEMP